MKFNWKGPAFNKIAQSEQHLILKKNQIYSANYQCHLKRTWTLRWDQNISKWRRTETWCWPLIYKAKHLQADRRSVGWGILLTYSRVVGWPSNHHNLSDEMMSHWENHNTSKQEEPKQYFHWGQSSYFTFIYQFPWYISSCFLDGLPSRMAKEWTLLVLCGILGSGFSKNPSWFENISTNLFKSPGDILIGGIFPINELTSELSKRVKPDDLECNR